MPVKLIGREGYFKGKTLFQIALNLKNFGVGRVVTRTANERYPEKSYYIITKVVPEMSDRKVSHGEAWGHKVFRSDKFEGVRKIEAGYKRDWILIPKEEEENYCRLTETDKRPTRVVPRYIEFPPLLKSFIKEEMEDISVGLPLKVKNSKFHNKGFQSQT